MSFWEQHMPAGMLVRSAWSASHLSDPAGNLTLDDYEATHAQPFPRPLPGEELCRYGRWFAGHAVPELDERRIATVERTADGFTLATEDGEQLGAERVVIATGLGRFAHRPPQFADLEQPLAIHSMDLTEPTGLAGRSVVVIGSGQSAVETAALVHEAGAEVELIARAPMIRWLIRGERLRGLDPVMRRLLYAPTDVGPAGLSRIVAMPRLFRRLPIHWRKRMDYRSIRPAATGWLFERTADMQMTLEHQVVRAAAGGGRVALTLDDGTKREVDHVVLATGYKVDVAREPVIGDSIRPILRLSEGYPVLGPGLQSSVPGLHFVGSYSAWSFGPVMRFVAGTRFAAPMVAEHIARNAPRSGSPRT
jgi:FAD-dependent urate hydroxylase